jgi:hypothetical protein
MFLLEIGRYLEGEHLGTLGDDLCLGEMPDKPDACVALFEYAGKAPDLHWNGEYPGLQVRTRGKTYLTARSKAGEIANALHGLHEKVLSAGEGQPGTRYLLIKAFGSPELLQKDASNRIEFVQHFEVIKER